jgi:multidrug efflux system membrane fusion protein
MSLGAYFQATKWPVRPALLVACGMLAAGCSQPQAAAPVTRQAIPVVVAKVEQKAMPVILSAIGNVEAYSTVAIRAQVAGELLEVHFKDGDFVTKDELLFTIDPRPYAVALAQAQANLARDKAVAANSRTEAGRYKNLFDQGVVAAEQLETYAASADSSEALVKADEAAIQAAELNVEYCKIYSPVAGRSGVVMVKAGNLVKVSDVPMAVINQINPVYVDFTVPQQSLADVKRFMAERTLTVQATVPNDPGPVEQGTLTFVDNAVDITTGTIHLKATFANEKDRLWPGLYVNTDLRLSEEPNATVVPLQAVTSGQQNKQMVYVVKPDNTVEARNVTISRNIANDAVVQDGLKPGEIVVTDGQMRLAPGAKVQVRDADGNSGPTGADSSSKPGAPAATAKSGETQQGGKQ